MKLNLIIIVALLASLGIFLAFRPSPPFGALMEINIPTKGGLVSQQIDDTGYTIKMADGGELFVPQGVFMNYFSSQKGTTEDKMNKEIIFITNKLTNFFPMVVTSVSVDNTGKLLNVELQI